MQKVSLIPNFSDKTDCYFASCGFDPAFPNRTEFSEKTTGNSFPCGCAKRSLICMVLLTSHLIDGRFVCNAAAQHIAAPEVQQKKLASFSSDMYSLGMTICAIYNQGRPLIQANHSCSDYLKQLETVSWSSLDADKTIPLGRARKKSRVIFKNT